MSRHLTDDEVDAWNSLASVVALMTPELETRLRRKCGLNYIQYRVLELLHARPGRRQRMILLAEATDASISRMSHIVAKLERAGLVTRSNDTGRHVELTDAGLDAFTDAVPHYIITVRQLLLDAWSTPQLTRQFATMTADLARHLKSRNPSPR
ncbi:MarR family winged helix-turn-helix transcriptional regulator [Nocardia sp. NPDC058633]|uniref:MarR family winged helix-turn-helix transcriptional regulator n=1 Tax=Nocardia sp. NPDC058633 TaxID=3346568 RepID=UPI00365E3900